MKLVDKIKNKIQEKVSSFKLRGEVSDTAWAEVSVTNITGSPLTLGTPFDDLKFRAQPLISGASFSQGECRLDNSHGMPLHQHSGAETYLVDAKTLSGALLAILGNGYYVLEENY